MPGSEVSLCHVTRRAGSGAWLCLRRLGAVVGLCALMAAAPLSAAEPGGAQQTAPTGGRIVGRVLDPQSRAGIERVRVRLDDGPIAVVTDAAGGFLFEGVALGLHRLVASLEGFAPSPAATVTVGASEVRLDIEYSLRLSTEVVGRAESPAALPPAELGTAVLSGRQVASAIGGLDDVGRVMQLRPGVAATQDNRNDLIVRGGGPIETLVRLDGFELPTASHFGGGGLSGGGVSLVASAVIARASLATTGFSAAIGERASSVLDVDVRSGATARLSGQFDVAAGGVLALAEGRLGGGPGSWLVSARRSILEIAFSRGATRATPSYVDLVAKVDTPIGRRHRAHLLVVGASDGLDVTWQTSSRARRIRDDQQLSLVGLAWRSTWTPSTETVVSVSHATNDLNLSELDVYGTTLRDLAYERTLRVRAELRRSFGSRVQWLTGVAIRRVGLRYDLYEGGGRNEFGILVPPVEARWNDQAVDTATYAEVHVKPSSRLRASVGVRGDRSGMTSSWYTSPRLRGEFTLGSRWQVVGSWGIYRQDIPFIWMGSHPDNRRLDPIRCQQATAGIEGEPWRGARVALEGFAKRYRGYPIDVNVPTRVLIGAGADFESPVVSRLVPDGLVDADGLDLSWSQRIGHGVDVAAGYSHWESQERNLEGRWIPADFDIRHQARLWLVYHRASRWSATALWRYASGRPYTPIDVAASIKAGGRRFDRAQTNMARYPSYQRLDVRVERVFVWKRAAITVFAEVDNLYDHDNVFMYEWDRSTRQPDPILQWGITPVGGLRIQF